MRTGNISVQTENILPIIKRFLYSDQEIFLRELVSNAIDATQKIKTLVARNEATNVDIENLHVTVTVDNQNNTITISDNGIGMTTEEVERYITQIAFSGATEFLEKYKNTEGNTNIIGHFGLGFYSAFMVANKVEIITQSHNPAADTVHWQYDGNTEYTIDTPTQKRTHGTDVILHIAPENIEYANNQRIKDLLNKYCRFLQVPIYFENNIINNPNPAWVKHPTELQKDDYLKFYSELLPNTYEEPLFWIHLNIDYPFNLTGILYFPKLKNSYEVKKDNIQLYCNQVFVTDHVKEIVPEFLTMLHGVIDSPDIPLNVSRSYLQSDPNVKQIGKYITRKVADKLDELFKNERPQFEQIWEHIGTIVKYGMITEEKFYDKSQNFFLLQNTQNQLFTLPELKEKVKAEQTNKHEKIVLLYANDTNTQHAYIENAKQKNYEVLLFDNLLDPHFIGFLENKHTDIEFKRVDADTLDNLIEKEQNIESVLTTEQQESVKQIFEKTINNAQNQVVTNALLPTEAPVIITQSEFLRRFKEMNNLRGGGGGMDTSFMPNTLNVVINTNHPLIAKIADNQAAPEQQQVIAQQLYDLALLQQNLLTGKELNAFVARSLKIIE